MQIEQEYELVAVEKLEEHPSNPRLGDVEAIDSSIEANGWYGVVTVQKSTGFILAGNHRYRAAVARGAKEVPVVWKDVDSETAFRIMLADNKTADLGGYDDDLLDEVLEGLESLEGTGFDRALEEASEAEDGGGAGDEEAGGGEDTGIPEDKYEPSWAVLVTCTSEEHQEQVYEDLQEQGYDLRVVSV